MNKIKLFLLWLFNLCPILSVSTDNEFGGIDFSDKTKRYSLLRLSFGFIKIYIASFKNGRFQLIKFINLGELRPWPTLDEVERKQQAYKEFIENKTDEELSINTRFLENQIGRHNDTKAYFQIKISIYSAVLLIVSGYLVYIFEGLLKSWHFEIQSYLLSFAFIIIFKNFSNCLFFVYSFSRNKSVSRSRFEDIKKNPTLKNLTASFYFDWFNMKEEINILSTYVKNIEKYLVKTVILVLFLSLVISVLNITNHKFDIQKNDKNDLKSITMLDENGNFNYGKLKELHLTLESMLIGDIKTIYLIRSNISKNEPYYNQVLSALDLFSEKTIVKELEITDYPSKQEILVIKPAK